MTEHPISEAMLAIKNATGHSIFGPSGAHRWFVCLASLIANHVAGDLPTFFAAEGSVAHWVAEQWLMHGEPHHLIGTTKTVDGFEITIDEDMLAYISEYVCIVSSMPGTQYTEVRVDLSKYTPIPSFGTSDHASAEWQILRITDFKYGKVWVDAQGNIQGLAYALGMFEELDWLYDFQTIEIRIAQPRRDNFGTWIITRQELLEFGEKFRERAFAAWNPDAPYTPDPKACENCAARMTCAPRLAVAKKLALSTLDDMYDMTISNETALTVVKTEMISEPTLPAFEQVSLADLARVYAWRSNFERYFREMGDYLERKLESGADVPGFKLAAGRTAHRKWLNEALSRKALLTYDVPEIDLYSFKFLSPKQASDILRILHGGTIKDNNQKIAHLCVTPEARQTMVPAHDVRAALPSMSSMFDDEDDL